MSDLPRVYKELRDRVRIHIKQIRKSRKKHPEYTVALLVAVASEALSTLRGQSDYVVFAKELLGEKYGVKKEVGRALFQAVRHGLAHRYDTALVSVGEQRVVVVIAWKHPELHLRAVVKDWLQDGVRRPGVYLDMETMWKELDSVFRRMTRRLQEERKFAKLVTRHGRWLEQKYTVRPCPSEAAHWTACWDEFLRGRIVTEAICCCATLRPQP